MMNGAKDTSAGLHTWSCNKEQEGEADISSLDVSSPRGSVQNHFNKIAIDLVWRILGTAGAARIARFEQASMTRLGDAPTRFWYGSCLVACRSAEQLRRAFRTPPRQWRRKLRSF
jgi:hypothetical protein